MECGQNQDACHQRSNQETHYFLRNVTVLSESFREKTDEGFTKVPLGLSQGLWKLVDLPLDEQHSECSFITISQAQDHLIVEIYLTTIFLAYQI